jgi:uncharacterized protein
MTRWGRNDLLKIAVTGATGLIGGAVVKHLRSQGHEVVPLVRTALCEEPHIYWNPSHRELEAGKLEGMDAVIHLAGESIAGLRWTREKKKRILKSRVQGTRFLCQALAAMARPPKVLLSASAIGYYGDRPATEEVDENSPKGRGFLAEVAEAWEAAAEDARASGIRVVNMRIGMVLSNQGGAFPKMLYPFKWGLGGKLGSGRQPVSWVLLDEIPHVVSHLLKKEVCAGPVNVVSPAAITNRDFAKAVADALGKPAKFHVPAPLVRLALGQMGKELLLGGCRVLPRVLLQTGYVFRYPELAPALTHLLGR